MQGARSKPPEGRAQGPTVGADVILDGEVKRQVRAFYDSVGWKQIGAGVYQNARYEDLRPVARDYIHGCHVRLGRYLPPSGRYFLDAGSGPIQYPEYLAYSRGYIYRVCLDLSRLALEEARRRIGAHGLYVVGDVTHLPFRGGAFEGAASLHTIHHVPGGEQLEAFREVSRVLAPSARAAVVYSWGDRSALMRLARPAVRLTKAVLGRYRRLRVRAGGARTPAPDGPTVEAESLLRSPGSFTYKHDYAWARRRLPELGQVDIRVWRSVSPAITRALIHPWLGGRLWLRLLYRLEELAPHFFGRHGMYPLILISPPHLTETSAGGQTT